MNARFTTFVLMICAVGIIAGCLPIPLLPGSDVYKTEHDIKELLGTNASRDEVINKLGIPARQHESAISYLVCRKTAGIGYIMCLGYQCGGADFRGKGCFELILEFDDHDRLSNYKKIPFAFKFDEKTPESMKLDYAREMAQKEIPDPPWSLYAEGGRDHKALVWLCRSAELGYTYAQMELGRIFWGSNDIKDNRSKSYMWYWLAAESEVSNEHYLDTRIQERADIEVKYKEDKVLTKEQVRLAMQLLLLLEPGQCERDLTEALHKESE